MIRGLSVLKKMEISRKFLLSKFLENRFIWIQIYNENFLVFLLADQIF